MSSHIQIPDIAPRIQYVGDGTITSFSYPFPVLSSDDITISFDAALQSGGYTVSGVGEKSGGDITFTTAPSNGTVITIERRLDLKRLTDFLEGADFSADNLNNELDYLTMLVQQINQDQVPMLRFDDSESINKTIVPLKADRANKVLGFDGDGNPKVVDTSDTYDVPDYTATGTGAITRTLTDKAREIVSVKDFGATGDGLTDDTTAIQAAIDAHNSILFPEGIYLISSALNIGEGNSLFGLGQSSVIKSAGNTHNLMNVTAGYTTIMNMTLENGDVALSYYGEDGICQNNVARFITIKTPNTGVLLDGFDDTDKPCDWNSFEGLTVLSPNDDGIKITVSSTGQAPKANVFQHCRVYSDGAAITGHGAYVEYGAQNNAFIDCDFDVHEDATSCIRIGANATKTVLMNIHTNSSALTPNIQLDSGSTETTISNLQSDSDGPAILDNSGGDYVALNAGFPEKNRLNRSRITDATLEFQRYELETVQLVSGGTVELDLTRTAYQVDATGGATTVELPDADSDNKGSIVLVKKIDTSSNIVTVTTSSSTGADGRDILLASQNDVVRMMSNGTSWLIASSNVMPMNTEYHDGTGTYAVDATKRMYNVSSFGGALTVQLPPANNAQSIGRIITVKKTDSSSNNVSVTEQGATGPDGAVQTLSSRYDAVTVMSDGNQWLVISKNS